MNRNIIAFLKYDESIKEFYGKDIFNDGIILFAGYSPQQLIGVQIHREAGMEKTKVYAISPYEEFL